MEWTVLPHPPYSPDLAPSNFHVFGSLLYALRGRRCPEDELKLDVRIQRRIIIRDNVYCLHLWATCFNLYTGHPQALPYI